MSRSVITLPCPDDGMVVTFDPSEVVAIGEVNEGVSRLFLKGLPTGLDVAMSRLDVIARLGWHVEEENPAF